MFGFPKASRLLRSVEFRLVQDGGRRASGGLLALTVRPRADGQGSRIGLAISKRVGNAVARNHVKRRVREAARHLLPVMPDVDVVVSGRPAAAAADAAAIRVELERLLRKAGVRMSDAPRERDT